MPGSEAEIDDEPGNLQNPPGASDDLQIDNETEADPDAQLQRYEQVADTEANLMDIRDTLREFTGAPPASYLAEFISPEFYLHFGNDWEQWPTRIDQMLAGGALWKDAKLPNTVFECVSTEASDAGASLITNLIGITIVVAIQLYRISFGRSFRKLDSIDESLVGESTLRRRTANLPDGPDMLKCIELLKHATRFVQNCLRYGNRIKMSEIEGLERKLSTVLGTTWQEGSSFWAKLLGWTDPLNTRGWTPSILRTSIAETRKLLDAHLDMGKYKPKQEHFAGNSDPEERRNVKLKVKRTRRIVRLHMQLLRRLSVGLVQITTDARRGTHPRA